MSVSAKDLGNSIGFQIGVAATILALAASGWYFETVWVYIPYAGIISLVSILLAFSTLMMMATGGDHLLKAFSKEEIKEQATVNPWVENAKRLSYLAQFGFSFAASWDLAMILLVWILASREYIQYKTEWTYAQINE